MGTLFLARDVTLDRPVAVKVVSPEMAASPEVRQRFLLEARTVARLRHPNIVSVYAAGESDGLLWFAMEYVPGESLRDRLQREKRIPSGEVIAITHDLAMALDDAHAAGVVHRDVKPENILLDRETGRAMLTDFGVVRALSSADAGLTGAGFVLGSPRYMSPEQASGEPTIDGRSDLYSLGLVAYEMLAGRPVIEAESAATILVKHLTEEPTPLRTLSTDLPDELDTVITQSLRKKPDERLPRGRAMAAALEGRDEADLTTTSGKRVISGARRVGSAKPQQSSRKRWLAIAAGVGVVALGSIPLLSGSGADAPDNSQTWLVAPFELQTGNASLDWLREGAVNMLGLTLSQWNDLSVIDYERTLDLLKNASNDESRRVGLEDARQIARRAQAGTVIMGQITTANDSMFVVARRYDVASGTKIDDATVGAPIGGDPRVLFERIARELLDLAGGPALSMELAKQTTESVEAYRLYLEGSSALNRWRLDEADTLFAQAIRIDSTFALAHYKRSLGLGWKNAIDSLYTQSSARAVEYSNRLAPRQRELIIAHHDLVLGFTAARVNDVDGAMKSWNSARDRLSTLLQTDSTDAEVWYGLADADYHAATVSREAPPDSTIKRFTRSMRAFERAVALDSTFHLAYEHLLSIYQIAIGEQSGVLIAGDSMVLATSVPDTARQRALRNSAQSRTLTFARGWVRQDTEATQAWEALTNAFAASRQYDSVTAILARLEARPSVYSASMAYRRSMFHAINDEIPEARRVLRLAVSKFPADSLGARSTTPGVLLPLMGMSVAGATGSLALLDSLVTLAVGAAETMPMVGTPTQATATWFSAGVQMGAGAPPTAALLRQIRAGIATLDALPAGGGTQVRAQAIGVPFAAYLATRDTTFALTAIKWAAETQRTLTELEALMALARKDSVEARTIASRFRAPDSLRGVTMSMGGIRVVAQAEVRALLGDLRGAAATYEAIDPKSFQIGLVEPGPALYTRSFLARARVYEQLNDKPRAIAAYEKFASAWEGADPSLHGELREARAAIARLRDAGSSRTITPGASPGSKP
jgi:serine/threonine-protein kinase